MITSANTYTAFGCRITISSTAVTGANDAYSFYVTPSESGVNGWRELTGRALREALKRSRVRAAFVRSCQLARRLRAEPMPAPPQRSPAGRVCSCAERWRVMFA